MASPVASALERLIPASLAAAIVVVLFVALIGSAVALFSMPLSIWTDRLPEIWHEMQRHLLELAHSVRHAGRRPGTDPYHRRRQGRDDRGHRRHLGCSGDRDTGSYTRGADRPVPGQPVFFLATRHSIRASVLSLCFSRRSRLRTARMFRDSEWFVSRYLLSITVINACLGAATTLAMWMLDVQQPYLWGMLAFCLNYIVYIGPAIMAVILLGVGLATWDTPPAIFLPMLAYLTLNMFEAQFVTPQVIGRSVTLNPFFVFLSLSFWIWIWGPAGGLLAVPFLLIGNAVIRNSLPMQGARAARVAHKSDKKS
jgi:predicted PurR-regulated permease PerM